MFDDVDGEFRKREFLKKFIKEQSMKTAENLKKKRENEKQRKQQKFKKEERAESFRQKRELIDRNHLHRSKEFDKKNQIKREELIVKEQSSIEIEKEKTRRELELSDRKATLTEAEYRAQSEIIKQEYQHQLKLSSHEHQQKKAMQLLANMQEMQVIREQGRQQIRQAEFNLQADIVLKKLDQALHEQTLQAERFNTNALEESRHVRELEIKNADLQVFVVQSVFDIVKMKLKNKLEKDQFRHNQMVLLEIKKICKEEGLDYDSLTREEITEMVAEFSQEFPNTY